MPKLDSYSGAAHFATQEAFEVQRQNHFEVVLDLPAGVTSGAFTGAVEHLRLSTKSMNAPKVTGQAIELKHGNETIKVAAAPTYDDLTITVYDTIGTDQLGIIQNWFSKVFDPQTHLMGLVSQYKATGTLYMYSPDCSITRTWTLYGVWPKEFGQSSEFSYDATDAQTIDLVLSVDKYVENLVAVR